MSGPLSSVGSALGWDQRVSDDVSIVVNGQQISGWEGVIIRMSLELMPWTFELETTEWSPENEAAVTIEEGAACQVMVGNDIVITGWVVTVVREMDAASHTVRVSGASKSTDLVDCSAKLDNYQVNGADQVQLARLICAKFGLTVSTVGPVGTIDNPQIDVILTETPYEVIERMCRMAGCLFYDAPDGNLVMSRAGSIVAASGFTEGDNVERAAYRASTADRYSEVTAVLQNTAVLYVSPDLPKLGEQMALITSAGPLYDPGIKRYRPLIIPTEMADAGMTVTNQRIQWEITRRWGRAYAVEITCDSWRDYAQTLWTVNTLAAIYLPTLKCLPSDRWVIGEVVLRRDLSGTHADIVLMPKQAFDPEPLIANPIDAELAQALRSQQAAGGSTSDTVTQEDLPPLTK